MPVAIAAALISVLGMAASATHPRTPIAGLARAPSAVPSSRAGLVRPPRGGGVLVVCLCGLAGRAMRSLPLRAPGLLRAGRAQSRAARLTMPFAPVLAVALGGGTR